MSKSKPEYLVSTDSIGFLGRPEQFIELWKEYFDNKTFDGVEIIAFKPLSRLSKLISTLGKNNIPVLSFHGKTGGENRLPPKYGIIMGIVNSFIFKAEFLVKNFREIEFLSHTPYLENEKIKNFIVNDKPKTLWIENHTYGKKGIKETIQQISDYRKNGVNAKGMFDLFHLLAKKSAKEMAEEWPQIIDDIQTFIKWFPGLHFPIGTRLDDSLPIDDMTDEMLKLFARKIVLHVERVVFENQQKNLGLFFSTDKMLADQKARNKRIFKRLKKTGVIKF